MCRLTENAASRHGKSKCHCNCGNAYANFSSVIYQSFLNPNVNIGTRIKELRKAMNKNGNYVLFFLPGSSTIIMTSVFFPVIIMSVISVATTT